MNFFNFLNLSSEEINIILLSLRVAFFCSIINLIPAIFLGWFLSKKEFYGKSFLISIIHLPLVLPPVIVGYLLLVIFSKNSLIGENLIKLGIDLTFNWKGAVLASAIMGFPLLVRSIKINIDLIDPKLEAVSKTLGKNSIKTFFQITLPLSLPGIVTGFILCFARSLGEFGATITFVSNIPNKTQTIPLAIYNFSQIPNSNLQILRLIVISVIISFLALIFSEIYLKKNNNYKT